VKASLAALVILACHKPTARDLVLGRFQRARISFSAEESAVFTDPYPILLVKTSWRRYNSSRISAGQKRPRLVEGDTPLLVASSHPVMGYRKVSRWVSDSGSLPSEGFELRSELMLSECVL
jgi:hypothetical protein